ncbi:hypothetical protein J6590_085509 [Homalodisca vitripennis]|nr:hypothetical protein J6590_085509 [Homalodisca vitripennis]
MDVQERHITNRKFRDFGMQELYYSPFSDMYIESTLVFECDSSMAIDWINKYIYCRRRGNSYFYEIDWTRQKPPRQLMSFYNNLQDMEVDPFARQLFFVENGQLSRLSIYENSRIKYDYEKLHLKKVLKIALDVELKFVYLIGIENDENHCLIKTDYEFKQMRVLYSGDLLTDPISLDVLKRDVIWGVKSDDGFFVYRCELTPRCLKDNIQRLYRSSEAIHDIKIYHPDKQPHNAMYLCSRLQCSHNCSATQDQVSCTCPDGMSLSSDNVTCQGITPF